MNEAADIKHELNFTVDDWDSLRVGLKESIMVDTNLSSLAKNVGLKWPIRGKEETPQKYIDYTLDELAELPEFYGKGNRLPLLYSILLETAQFDDPFADMTGQFDDSVNDEDEIRATLHLAGVPMNYPVSLMHFTRRTRDLCMEGGHEDLDKLITFLMESKTAIIMNNEFRQFIACLKSHDKSGLAQYLPIRPGSKGIYLAEALGLLARKLSAPDAATLIYAFKLETNREDWGEDAVKPKDQAQQLIENLQAATKPYLDLMPDQANHLESALRSGISSSVRFFITLNDEEIESLALAIAIASLEIDRKPRYKGLLGRFIN